MKGSCQINYRVILKIYCLILYLRWLPSIEDRRATLDNKEVVAVISLDLSKAFDCIPRGLLLVKLKAYGVAEPGIAPMRNNL